MKLYLSLMSLALVATTGCAVESSDLEMGSVDQALTCDDSVKPPNGGTCAEAVAYNWCGQSWMVVNGADACALSCGLCTAATTTTTTTTTTTPAIVLPPATNLLGQSCTTSADTFSTAAALAVAVGKEMGRWQAMTDFELGNQQVYVESWNWTGTVYSVKLSAAGEALCQSRAGNCAEVRRILAMQGAYDLWDAGLFANRLIAGWQSLKADVDAGRCSATGPTVTFLNGRDDAAMCGRSLYRFTVSSTDPKVAACQMTMYDHGGTVEISGRDVTHDFNGDGTAETVKTYKTDNPFIMFTVTGTTTVDLDPTDSTTAGTSTTTLACWDAPSGLVYDPPVKAKLGQCCMVNGVAKTLHAYTTSWDKCY